MLSPEALAEIAQVEAEIDRIEAQRSSGLAAPPDNQVQQVELLGKAMLYDKQLSVNRNEACAFCHMPETGFTGPVSELNRTTGSYPGSVRTRFSDRKPQSHAYAPLSPVLHYNPGQGDLVGGNFWDMRATGRRLGNPAASRRKGRRPTRSKWACPISPAPSIAPRSGPIGPCSKSVWGRQAFAIDWPTMWSRSAPGPGRRRPVIQCRFISARLIGTGVATFDQMAQSIASYEASAEVTAFTSKFDAVLAGKAQFTAQEQAGYDLSAARHNATPVTATAGRARSRCSPISRPAISELPPIRGSLIMRKIGPTHSAMSPIQRVVIRRWRRRRLSPAGIPLSQPSAVDSRWRKLAPDNQARFQVPTLRNVDKRPYPAFVKAYGHNGYFKSLKAIVHFYNTRDACRAASLTIPVRARHAGRRRS